ncbi:hypothetical protein [Microbulbifer epialgicus]|uniref:Uncharacterized protein n=1 Tax=Microbulbifer epialgicus TaxID=393907 RepID=A0ABV4NTN4_9GAMM
MKVRIISSQEHEPSDDPDQYYIGPERNDIELEGVNCTVDQFLNLFLDTKEGEGFCRLGATGMVDIGGSYICSTPGEILSVSFDDWLRYRVEKWDEEARRENLERYRHALSKINIIDNPRIKNLDKMTVAFGDI